ncbi:copper homeostasis protein CutC [Paracoccus panacisoli]|uniref:PF03932 family protein CutC n=1 Tax=Paracoccus panacisoli TaxID=1510163 RepID=A0ABV6T3M0_9RHOB
MAVEIEIVVDDPAGLDAAAAAGVDSIELCGGLALGALTPSAGLMARAARCGVRVAAMIRPRPGDFRYDAAELAVMRDDILAAGQAGLWGVALGVTDADRRLDRAALGPLIAAAGGMAVTIHRAFGVTPDPRAALEDCVALGVARIMTAGHAPTAAEGTAGLRALVDAARGRVAIMAGGGVSAGNAAALMAAGVNALHASCSAMRPVAGPLGALRIAPERMATDPAAIRALIEAVRGPEPAGDQSPR